MVGQTSVIAEQEWEPLDSGLLAEVCWICREELERMLEAANWAPTHGRTEPWRYVVLGQEGMQAFANATLEVRTVPSSNCMYAVWLWNEVTCGKSALTDITLVNPPNGKLRGSVFWSLAFQLDICCCC